jgi:D-sedoheptulose 7-phosphate isomerase
VSTPISQSRPPSQSDLLARVQRAFAESARVKQSTAEQCGPDIAEAGRRLAECFRQGGKALLFGNGGSASDAQHIAAEWVGRYVNDRPALPAVALTANTSELTAIANDYGFDELFVRGIAAHGRPADVAVAISTSGNSPNVLLGVEAARQRGLFTIGLSGRGGGKLDAAVDLSLVVPSDETPRIQESHIAIGHVLCELVELELFGIGEGAAEAGPGK